MKDKAGPPEHPFRESIFLFDPLAVAVRLITPLRALFRQLLRLRGLRPDPVDRLPFHPLSQLAA